MIVVFIIVIVISYIENDFFVLVCEEEIERGLLDVENRKKSCVWFHRAISGLDTQDNAEHPEVLKYLDVRPDGEAHSDESRPKVLLENLKNKRMKEAIDSANLFTYDVTWTPKGNRCFTAKLELFFTCLFCATHSVLVNRAFKRIAL